MPGIATARVRQDHDYPMVGETIGLWRLVRGLGRGGMGEVYEAEYDYIHVLTLRYAAEQRDLIRRELDALPRRTQAAVASQVMGTPMPADMRFAIKICNARSGTPGYRRFLQEAEVAQRLGDHPYIVTVHQVSGPLDVISEMSRRLALDSGTYRDLAYMVMDLASCRIEPTQLTVAEAVHVVRCIATALDHAHSQGVVHRDLKPENILGSVEHPLLTDFGIAKEIDHSEGLTRTGQIIGTLDYMSPEQATDAKRVDYRSDIYSLGVVLYEFATQGHLPYSDKLDRDSCLAAIRSERVDPRWPREHMARFPVRLERIILKAMAHRQEDRYQAMSDFITDLDRFTRGEPIGWFKRVNTRALLRFHLRRHPRLVWGAATVLAAVLIACSVLWIMQMMDANRHILNEELDKVTAQVGEMETTRRHWILDRAGEDMMRDLRTRLSTNRYPGLSSRLANLEDQLLKDRRLSLAFVASNERPSDPEIQPAEMLEQLKLAANSPQFEATASGTGLRILDNQSLTLPHFGKGTVFCYLVVRLPPTGIESFSMTAQEEDTYSGGRHIASWSVRANSLQFSLQQDEEPPKVLRQTPPNLDKEPQVSIAMELSGGAIRTWVTGELQSFPLRGLRDGAPATVVLNLPKDSYVEKLYVLPVGPR